MLLMEKVQEQQAFTISDATEIGTDLPRTVRSIDPSGIQSNERVLDLENFRELRYTQGPFGGSGVQQFLARMVDHLAKSTPSTIFSISCPIGICVGFDSSELTVTLAVPGHSHLRLEQLRLSFKTKLLRDICERDRTAVDAFGAEHAALLQDALAELRASPAIADMPRWRERLTTVGSKQLEFEYAGTVVVHIEANHVRPPVDSRDGLVWERVTSVKILKVEIRNVKDR
jgi:hypothetical protein